MSPIFKSNKDYIIMGPLAITLFFSRSGAVLEGLDVPPVPLCPETSIIPRP